MTEASSGPKEKILVKKKKLFEYNLGEKIYLHTHSLSLWFFQTTLIKWEHSVFSLLLKASSLSLSCWIYNAKKQNPRNLFLFT